MTWRYLLDLVHFIPLLVKGFNCNSHLAEIFGMEISFSRSEGIFVSPPRQCSGVVFRKAVKIGPTKVTEAELKAHLLSIMYDSLLVSKIHFESGVNGQQTDMTCSTTTAIIFASS